MLVLMGVFVSHGVEERTTIRVLKLREEILKRVTQERQGGIVVGQVEVERLGVPA
jgi:hypothetical protein